MNDWQERNQSDRKDYFSTNDELIKMLFLFCLFCLLFLLLLLFNVLIKKPNNFES